MHQQKGPVQPDDRAGIEPAAEAKLPRKPYVAPQLELLDIEATRNSPGGWPDAGINYS